MAKLTQAEKEEYAAEARNALNTRVIALVFKDLEDSYIAVLKSTNVGDLPAQNAHASLRVIEDVKARLLSYANMRV